MILVDRSSNQNMGRDGSSSRERLVQAAIRLFWQKGYTATGMAELLKEARVNSGSFYYFFDSKEALLIAVLDWYKENISPALLEPAFENTDDPIERIFALLERYRNLICRPIAPMAVRSVRWRWSCTSLIRKCAS